MIEVTHNGRTYNVKQDHVCAHCKREIHVLVFDVRKSDNRLYTTCIHCQQEHVLVRVKGGQSEQEMD